MNFLELSAVKLEMARTFGITFGGETLWFPGFLSLVFNDCGDSLSIKLLQWASYFWRWATFGGETAPFGGGQCQKSSAFLSALKLTFSGETATFGGETTTFGGTFRGEFYFPR